MLKIFKNCFNFYIKSSLHVALSVSSLGLLSFNLSTRATDKNVLIFIFFCTLFAYNFIKYYPLVRSKSRRKISTAIIVLSVLSAVVTFGLCFTLTIITRGIVILGGLLVFLYTIPFFGENSNWRNKKGWKINLVALSWILLTVGVPLTSLTDFPQTLILKWSFIQFVYVWVATLTFEIRDFSIDTLSLRTIPQQLGIRKTKIIGFFLLIIGLIFAIFIFPFNYWTLLPIIISYSLLGVSLYFCSTQMSIYFTNFWIEGIPIIWWLSSLLISYFY